MHEIIRALRTIDKLANNCPCMQILLGTSTAIAMSLAKLQKDPEESCIESSSLAKFYSLYIVKRITYN